MTADLSRLDGLRHRLGATQVAVDAFEMREGTRITDPAKIAEYDRLLRENAESRLWLTAAEAELTGQYFNVPNQIRKLDRQFRAKAEGKAATNIGDRNILRLLRGGAYF